jgi:hypothetical protein
MMITGHLVGLKVEMNLPVALVMSDNTNQFKASSISEIIEILQYHIPLN